MSDTPRTPIQDRIASMMHAFDDQGRRYAVRLLAQDVGELERELTAAQAEIARLKAGGCARDQRTTQFCGEALKLQEENARLQERIRNLQQVGGQLADSVRHLASDDPVDALRIKAWNKAWIQAKETQ